MDATLLWIGRILFSLIFVFAGLGHFMQLEEMSQYAASKSVPLPKIMVAVTGLMLVAGGLSILFWKYVVVGSWLLIIFLGLAAIKMHNFWSIEDPMQRQNEMNQFMKNVALLGATLVFYLLAANNGSLPS